MATYVRTAQAPWWGNLAANLGTTILGGLWNEWQQREKNKKTNAYQGELLSQLQELGGLQDNTQSQETGILNTPMPEGYNSDGWANSFHKTDTPLTQFDLGTAPNAELGLTAAPNTNAANAWANLVNGINPLAQFDNGVAGILGANAGQQAQARRTPTALEIYNTAMKLAATDRFKSMNPDTVQNILTPYLKLNEEARQEQRRQEAADAYINAGNDRDMLNQLYRGAIQGTVPEALLGRGQDRFYRDNPDLQTLQVDSGDSISILGRNPRNNELRLLGEFGKNMSPYERAKLNADIEQKNADRQFEYDKLRQENQGYQGTVTDADGVTWIIRKGGGRERLSEAQGLSEQQRERLKNNAATLVNIRKEREGLEARRRALIRAGAGEDDPNVREIDGQIRELRTREQGIMNENNAITRERTARNQQNSEASQFAPLPPVPENVDTTQLGKGQGTQGNNAPNARADSGDVQGNNAPNTLPVSRDVQGNNVPNTPAASRDAQARDRSIFDFLPTFGATPAYADENISGAADGNSEAEIQRAIDNLNGQFGEQRWEDWASGLGVRNTLNEINNNRQGITANPPYTDPNKPINILGVPLVYPNGDYNRYAAMGGRDLLNRDLRSPEEILRNITPMPNYTPNTNDLNIVPLADKRRARPQQVLSGRYSGDTRNGGKYSSIINRHAKAHDVDPDLIAAIIQQESGGNSQAVSDVGAQGLMQLMPKTARGLGVTNPFDPEQNIAGGTKYIAQMLKRYNGNIEKALWAYNAGPGNADKGRLPNETKKYIPSVMARYRKLKGIAAPSNTTPKKTVPTPARRRRRTRSRVRNRRRR